MRNYQQFARSTFLGLLALLALSQVEVASSQTGLADWCVNVNGDINTACNGAGSGGTSPGNNASIGLAGFDTTLEPGTNSLGSIVITLNPGFSGYASFYADYDLDYLTYGSFQDSATTGGTLPAGYSYEAADPNVSNIFSDFSGSALPDTNSVGTASGPPVVCCDVAFALSVGDLVNTGTVDETLSFLVSATAPGSGFYIKQTNLDLGDSIYLSAVSSSGPPPPPPTPEPAPLVLVALGGLSMLMFRRLCAAR
jgi:hypothetical protein